MKLETCDEPEEGNPIFCSACGRQVQTLDEIHQRVCSTCQNTKQQASENPTFYCWACGKHLSAMSEIAQGLCSPCRASILRKLK